IGGYGDAGHGLAALADNVPVVGRVVVSLHALQGGIAAALQRQVQVGSQPAPVAGAGQQGQHHDGVGRLDGGDAQAGDGGAVEDRADGGGEVGGFGGVGGGALALGVVLAVLAHVHAGEHDLLVAFLQAAIDQPDDLVSGRGARHAPGEGYDAE